METAYDITPKTESLHKPLLVDYELLASLFEYPADQSYPARIKEIHSHFSKCSPESAIAMKTFVEFTEISSLREMQELFLRSFDLQAITTLDIGFILFGEDYKRGQLLVGLNQEHLAAGNPCNTELSDHLPNILRLLPKMKDFTMRDEIATRLVIPAIVKMRDEFEAEKIEKKDEIYKKHLKVILDYSDQYRTVYQTLLQALFVALKNDFGYEEAIELKPEVVCENPLSCSCSGADLAYTQGIATPKDFSQNIETEMLTEK